MFEKVNPSHPDKIADRIAGALVDLAYSQQPGKHPRIAVEVLIGHGKCSIIAETSVRLKEEDVRFNVKRIAGDVEVEYREFAQDPILSLNQSEKMRCGDNGIFKGVPTTEEQEELSRIARYLYEQFPHDGKFILQKKEDLLDLIICQSNAGEKAISCILSEYCQSQVGEERKVIQVDKKINPLGYWTGGLNTDSGATNRKLGSDMGDAVTGGGLHGKDLSKADVSVNIYAHLKAQETKQPVELYCAIGDEYIDGKPYSEIVEIAHEYIQDLGGFEKLAEWGLI